MTKDLALCVSGGKAVKRSDYLTTTEFMEAVSQNLKQKVGNTLAKLWKFIDNKYLRSF